MLSKVEGFNPAPFCEKAKKVEEKVQKAIPKIDKQNRRLQKINPELAKLGSMVVEDFNCPDCSYCCIVGPRGNMARAGGESCKSIPDTVRVVYKST